MSSTTTVRVRAELEKNQIEYQDCNDDDHVIRKSTFICKKKKEHLMTATTDVEVWERC